MSFWGAVHLLGFASLGLHVALWPRGGVIWFPQKAFLKARGAFLPCDLKEFFLPGTHQNHLSQFLPLYKLLSTAGCISQEPSHPHSAGKLDGVTCSIWCSAPPRLGQPGTAAVPGRDLELSHHPAYPRSLTPEAGGCSIVQAKTYREVPPAC